MRWCPGDAGPGRRIQYNTVQYSTAQHMIYHTISRKQNKGVWAVPVSQAKQLKSKQTAGQMPQQTGRLDGVKTPEAKPAAQLS